jgi:hypothetical protein
MIGRGVAEERTGCSGYGGEEGVMILDVSCGYTIDGPVHRLGFG